jgi:hypothetical protein
VNAFSSLRSILATFALFMNHGSLMFQSCSHLPLKPKVSCLTHMHAVIKSWYYHLKSFSASHFFTDLETAEPKAYSIISSGFDYSNSILHMALLSITYPIYSVFSVQLLIMLCSLNSSVTWQHSKVFTGYQFTFRYSIN